MDLALPSGVDAGDVVGVGSHGCGCTLGARPASPPLVSLISLISLLLFRFRTKRA
jgi:hypothetical protein